MSQASHTIYKQLVPLEKKYKYYKRSGSGGIRDDVYQSMILHYKYDSYYQRLSYMHDTWGLSDEAEVLLNNKMKNDTELIQLNRIVRILKIQLLKKGYNKKHL